MNKIEVLKLMLTCENRALCSDMVCKEFIEAVKKKPVPVGDTRREVQHVSLSSSSKINVYAKFF